MKKNFATLLVPSWSREVDGEILQKIFSIPGLSIDDSAEFPRIPSHVLEGQYAHKRGQPYFRPLIAVWSSHGGIVRLCSSEDELFYNQLTSAKESLREIHDPRIPESLYRGWRSTGLQILTLHASRNASEAFREITAWNPFLKNTFGKDWLKLAYGL